MKGQRDERNWGYKVLKFIIETQETPKKKSVGTVFKNIIIEFNGTF